MAVKDLVEENVEYRRAVARDPEASDRVLRTLANDEDIMVRTFVAINPSCPKDVSTNLIENNKIVKKYCVDVYDVYGQWGWDFNAYEDEVCDNFTDYAVVFYSNYETTDAEWWVDAANDAEECWDSLQKSETKEQFIKDLIYEYGEDYLGTVYDVYEGCGRPEVLDEDFIAALVLAVNDLEEEELYNLNGEDRAYVIYDPDHVDIDLLREWLYGIVYELRVFETDLNNLPDRDILDEYECYFDYGNELESELVSDTEFQRMKESGLMNECSVRFGLELGEFEVLGDV